MITPTNIIEIPAQTADGLWVSNIMIDAPSTSLPITANIRVTPYNSTTGVIYYEQSKYITLNDVMVEAGNTPSVFVAMQAIFTAVQELVNKQKLF